MYGGQNALALNALMSAFWEASGGEEEMYDWLDATPKTSLVVELVDALDELGFKIVPKNL